MLERSETAKVFFNKFLDWIKFFPVNIVNTGSNLGVRVRWNDKSKNRLWYFSQAWQSYCKSE